MESWDRSFSWSKINTYDTCGRQFRFKYVDELESDVESEARTDGINFHEYMEEYYEHVGDKPTEEEAVELAMEMFDEYEQAKYRDWIKHWHNWNVGIHERFGQEHWKPVERELWIEVEPEGDLPTKYIDVPHWEGDVHHGYIDALWWNPNKEHYVAIDYKSKAKDGSRIKGQTTYYTKVLLELWEQLDEPVGRAGCYGYKTGNFKTWSVHWKSIKALRRKVDSLRALEDGFEPEFGMHCEWCDYQEECVIAGSEQENSGGLLDV